MTMTTLLIHKYAKVINNKILFFILNFNIFKKL